MKESRPFYTNWFIWSMHSGWIETCDVLSYYYLFQLLCNQWWNVLVHVPWPCWVRLLVHKLWPCWLLHLHWPVTQTITHEISLFHIYQTLSCFTVLNVHFFYNIKLLYFIIWASSIDTSTLLWKKLPNLYLNSQSNKHSSTCLLAWQWTDIKMLNCL